MDVGLLLASVTAVIIGGLILAEIDAWAPRISTFLALFAAKRLSLSDRTRFKEEWLAYLAEMPTGISKLVASLGFVFVAERARFQVGIRAVSAVGLYLRLRLGMLRYTTEAKAFGGRFLAFRAKREPCGNRHVFLAGLFPSSAMALIDQWNATVRREIDDEQLDLTAQRAAIVDRAMRTRHSGPLVASRRWTNVILPRDRDPRPIRTLFAILWKTRRKRIRGRLVR